VNLQAIRPVSKCCDIKIFIVINVGSVVYPTISIMIKSNILDDMPLGIVLPGKDAVNFVVVSNVSLVKLPDVGVRFASSFRTCALGPYKSAGVAVSLYPHRY